MKKGLSLYSVDEEKLNVLQPDIIVTQGLCSVCAVSETTIEVALREMYANCLFAQKSYPLPVCLLIVYVLIFDSSLRKQAKKPKPRYIFQMKKESEFISKEGNESLLLEWIDPIFCRSLGSRTDQQSGIPIFHRNKQRSIEGIVFRRNCTITSIGDRSCLLWF